MTPTHPSPEAMAVAQKLWGQRNNEGAKRKFAVALDAFARAGVEEERAAWEAALQRVLGKASCGDTSAEQAEIELAAISARRGRG